MPIVPQSPLSADTTPQLRPEALLMAAAQMDKLGRDETGMSQKDRLPSPGRGNRRSGRATASERGKLQW